MPAPRDIFTNIDAFSRVKTDRNVLCAFLGNADVSTLDNYSRKGWVVKTGHGKYLLLASVQSVVRHLMESASGRIGKEENVDAVRANAELKDTQRRLTQLKIDQLEGTLITLPEIEAAWTEISLNVKAMFLSLPGRARFLMPHLTGEDQTTLDGLVRDMLSEVAYCVDPPRLPARKTEDDGRDSAPKADG